MNRSTATGCLVLFMFLVFSSLQGCAGSGRFFLDQSATAAFDFYEVKPGMNYYIMGSNLYPSVLMGLNKNYDIEATSWKKTEMTSDLMKEIVTGMKQNASAVGQSLAGYVIYDPNEKPIGIWYSTDYLTSTTTLRLRKDQRIMIHNPDLESLNTEHGAHP
ncbi:MAG TPA: hypothetical protein VHO70_22435 [Chitinispirillaceae bacterium]|nr:hypothetical protein [Chitinispirillaceae bacterium]